MQLNYYSQHSYYSLTQHTVTTLSVITHSHRLLMELVLTSFCLTHYTLFSYLVRITWLHCDSSMHAVVFMSGFQNVQFNLVFKALNTGKMCSVTPALTQREQRLFRYVC